MIRLVSIAFRPLLALVAILALVALSSVGSGSHASAAGSTTYQYLIGTDFLCTLGPDVCPDIARAPNGDTFEVTGQGTLSQPGSASGGGTFVHRDAAGNVLGSGTWTATGLIAFKSFGQDGSLPEGFSGGHALLAISLDPGDPGGPTIGAGLQVDCDLGTNPPGLREGIKVLIPAVHIAFNEKVSGGNIFILQ